MQTQHFVCRPDSSSQATLITRVCLQWSQPWETSLPPPLPTMGRTAEPRSSTSTRGSEHPVLTTGPQATSSASGGPAFGLSEVSSTAGGSAPQRRKPGEAGGLPQRKQEAEPRATRTKTTWALRAEEQRSAKPDGKPKTQAKSAQHSGWGVLAGRGWGSC